ncbi:hypothetical protein HPP92_013379 [Vanilla planifolia]|uniref:Uncharacterized protein n=1 Tax=Vanilla planifolia TaxID=51239 RepID=A0A835UZY1_VANPL|nr:hypothetical protein HPP92_013810 [Vanilla planifolia]KAG0478660.1 hypothetical protein HPP92_013379 [Vanilla planifolia]
MPPVDLETPFASEGDRNVSCETQVSTLTGSASAGLPLAKPNVRPESLHVPIRNEIHWVKLLDRGQSTIGHANPKSNRNSSKPKSVAPRLATTARASKPNGPIIAVPTKTKRSIFSGNSVRPVTNLYFFPRKIAVIDGEWNPAFADTVSPKASCFCSVFSNKASRRRSDSSAADVEVRKKGHTLRVWLRL